MMDEDLLVITLDDLDLDALLQPGSPGAGLAGVAGKPLLAWNGFTCPGAATELRITQAAPEALAVIVLGVDHVATPFKSGVLATTPLLALGPWFTDAQGTLRMPGTWPAGVAPDTLLVLQAWVADGRPPQGAAGSESLLGLTP